MAPAYSDEVSSCGYWPGGAAEGIFYTYAYPEPSGFRTADASPADAYFDEHIGEFVLQYAAVRTASDPDRYLRELFEATLRAARDLAAWPMTDPGSAA
jgi:Family of unknown function (DUF5996)